MARSRQYLWDRANGTSKYDEESRPPCRPCWVPPCVYYCSCCLEQNVVCEFVGRQGFIRHDDKRGRVNSFRVALVASKLATLFSVLSCLAISQRFHVLWIAPFSEGTVSVVNRTLNNASTVASLTTDHKSPVSEVRIGLTAVAIRDAFGDDVARSASTGQITSVGVVPEQVITFDEFCSKIDRGLEYYMDPLQCDECHKASNGLVTSCILGAILDLPGMFSDVLRMYPNYDVNCQKFFGTVTVAISLLVSVYTARGYSQACFENFYDGNVGFDQAGNASRPGAEQAAFLNFSWRIGNGLIFLFVSMACKAVNIVFCMLVQTPPITRDRKEQDEYERLFGNKEREEEEENSAETNGKKDTVPSVIRPQGEQEEPSTSC